MEIISWVGLSILFFLVAYLAVLNVLEDIIQNDMLRFFVIALFSIPMSFLMAIFSYQPIFMIAIASVANYYRIVQKSQQNDKQKTNNYSITYQFVASYTYLFLLCALGYYFQMPVQGDEGSLPYWKTLLPEE